MGDPAPPRKGEQVHMDHDLLNPSAGMGAKSSIDYRFDLSIQQIRDGAYPLHMAVGSGASLEVVEMLLKEAGDVAATKTNKFGETALHVALRSQTSSPEVVKVLIQAAPTALHVREKKGGNLPIHYAAKFGCSNSVAVAKALLENWEEAILERNDEHMSPLDLARQSDKCSEDVFRLLELTDESVV